jgi:aromatic ring hydroxylase
MTRLASLALALSLAACSTAQVQTTCRDTAVILEAAQPFLVAAPPEVQAAITIIGAGTVACDSPQYAAARNQVIAWLIQRGVKLPAGTGL